MGDYRAVSEALSGGADPDMLCMTCPWDRFCLTPPTVTRSEIDEAAEKAKRDDEAATAKAREAGKDPGMPVGLLIHTLAMAGKDTSAQICPVLALRLRTDEGAAIVGAIRSRMRGDA